MGAMAKALINGKTLSWARERAALSVEEVASRMNQSIERVLGWEGGTDQPTFRQAQKLANIVHVPFGFLFLRVPPEETLPLPDLRTLGSVPARVFDLNTLDLLRDIRFKHDWFVDVLEEQGHERLPFVGQFSINSNPEEVAAAIRQTLKLESEARGALNWEDYLRRLMHRAEDAGIWVMRSGIVGSNTHRVLSVEQFRGFAISHPIAPLIFINGRDAKAAQIFTLAHELAHIWIGASGISNILIGRSDYGTSRNTEVFCNKVAAELLVPAQTFSAQWLDKNSPEVNIDRLTRYFKVSRIVVARRALDLGKIAADMYQWFHSKQEAEWQKDADDVDSGGNFYVNLPIRNGRRFTYEVASQTVTGRTLFRDAASLLNIKPALIPALLKKARTI
jgi:Zn-dependent peptidase ImmA (M78 family)